MTTSAGTLPIASRTGVFTHQLAAQITIFGRNPTLTVISLALPIMLWVFFGLPYASTPYLPGLPLGVYMLASFAAYALSSAMVFNFGVTIALDRGQKVDVLMRSTPLPGWIFLLTRALAAVLFGTIAVLALFAFAIVLGGVRLEPGVWVAMLLSLLVGSVPFIGLGFAVSYLVSPAAAPAAANLLYMFLAFASGLFVRIDQMPDFLQRIAPFLPTYHYAQLAWSAVGAPADAPILSVAWLAGYAVVLFGLATWAYRQDAKRKFA